MRYERRDSMTDYKYGYDPYDDDGYYDDYYDE